MLIQIKQIPSSVYSIRASIAKNVQGISFRINAEYED